MNNKNEMHMFFEKHNKKERNKPLSIQLNEECSIFVKWFFFNYKIYSNSDNCRIYKEIEIDNRHFECILLNKEFFNNKTYFKFFTIENKDINNVEIKNKVVEEFKKDFTMFILSTCYVKEKWHFKLRKFINNKLSKENNVKKI